MFLRIIPFSDLTASPSSGPSLAASAKNSAHKLRHPGFCHFMQAFVRHNKAVNFCKQIAVLGALTLKRLCMHLRPTPLSWTCPSRKWSCSVTLEFRMHRSSLRASIEISSVASLSCCKYMSHSSTDGPNIPDWKKGASSGGTLLCGLLHEGFLWPADGSNEKTRRLS